MKRKWLAVGGLMAVVVAAGLALRIPDGFPSWAGGAAVTQAAAAASAPPLEFSPAEVVRPVRTTMNRTIEFSGPLVAPGTAIVRAKAAGTLLAMTLVEGNRVAAGQVLARIDINELTNRIAERQAQLESARAAWVLAERNHASNERLAAQSFISPIALGNSRAQLDSARAVVAAAQASLDSTRVGTRDAAPLAPISGIVAKRHALPGERVAMEQPLLTIVDLRRLELAGQIGTHEVASLVVGMAVTVKVEGVERPLTGTLARIAPAAEPGTRSIGVTIALDNPGERLRAGQYAMASVTLADEQPRLALPMTAVVARSGLSHVWLIERGVLVQRAVVTGRVDESRSRVEVVSGLDDDAQVLAARYDNLREGAKALVRAGQAPALASAAGRPKATAGSGAVLR